MKLNIQKFATLNVGDTYETSPVNIKPYGYNSNAYQMKFTVKLNSQNTTNFTSNITITSYMRTLNNSWGWSGFNKNYMERYTKVNDEVGYTFRNNTQLTSLPTNNVNNWVNCGSWSDNIPHKSDGTCTLYVKSHLNTSASSNYSYIPRDTEQESEALTLHQLHKSPKITINTMTELNTYLTGVADNVIVQNLSKKQITFSTELDNATIQSITISNGSTIATGTSSPITIDFSDKTLYTVSNLVPIKAIIVDSPYGSFGDDTKNYTYIPYTKPTINASTTVKRNGQLSGKVLLNLAGTYYSGTIGNITNSIVIQYRFWEKDTTEPSSWNLIPNASIVINNNDITVSNYEIGSNDTTASNYFNPEKAYNVRIRILDAFRDINTGYYKEAKILKTIPLGESVWDEYKDRVNFKKITRQNEEVFCNEYSNSEKIVGKWVDNKPIYRKVIDFGALPDSTSKTYGVTNLSIDNIIAIKGIAKSDVNTTTELPTSGVSGVVSAIELYCWHNTILTIFTHTDMSSYSAYIILEYTKTTD